MLKNFYKTFIPEDIQMKISSLRRTIRHFVMRYKIIFKRNIFLLFEHVTGHETYPYKKYCDKYKCIFIHIPKNAGTSIITLLNDGQKIEQEHNPYWDYFRSDSIRFNSYHVFCVIRNPWDRLLSAYNYLSNGGNKNSDENLSNFINSECLDFHDFVMNWLDYDKINNVKVLNPQFMYIYDYHNKKIMVENILRYESLDADFSLFQKKLDISEQLPWINKSKKMNYIDSYTKEMIERVGELYQFDINLLGYSFEVKNDS